MICFPSDMSVNQSRKQLEVKQILRIHGENMLLVTRDEKEYENNTPRRPHAQHLVIDSVSTDSLFSRRGTKTASSCLDISRHDDRTTPSMVSYPIQRPETAGSRKRF